jgi:cell division protein FtsN
MPMSRFPHLSTLAACLLAVPAAVVAPRASNAQTVALTAASPSDTIAIDAALARARRQATDGDLAGARLVLDSLANLGLPGSPRLAEVLFWRATYAQTASGAERDYRRIVVEHPMSARSEDALLRLSQLELARGDQQLAVRHLERLVLEHPDSPNRPRAQYWMARAWMDAGDAAKGCAALGQALASASSTDAELRNQVRYTGQRCPRGWDVAATPAPEVATVATSVATNVATTSARVPAAPVETTVVRRDSAPARAPAPLPSHMPASLPTTLPPMGVPTPRGDSSAGRGEAPSRTSVSAPIDSMRGRSGQAPNTNITPAPQQTVTTSAPTAPPARPAVIVPPLGRPPVTAPGSGGLGAPASKPTTTPPRSTTAAPANTTSTMPPRVGAGAAPGTTASTTTVTTSAATPPLATRAAPPVTPTTSAPVTTPARAGAGAPAGARRTIYSVQLAAYDTRPAAEALAKRLTNRGIDARVSGEVAPFRVRVGRYAAYSEAARELAALKAKGLAGFVAEEPVQEGTR